MYANKLSYQQNQYFASLLSCARLATLSIYLNYVLCVLFTLFFRVLLSFEISILLILFIFFPFEVCRVKKSSRARKTLTHFSFFACVSLNFSFFLFLLPNSPLIEWDKWVESIFFWCDGARDCGVAEASPMMPIRRRRRRNDGFSTFLIAERCLNCWQISRWRRTAQQQCVIINQLTLHEDSRRAREREILSRNKEI